MISKGFECNYITVISDERIKKGRAYFYKCLCKCGNIRDVSYFVLKNHQINDCGCNLFGLDAAKKQYIGNKYNMLTINDCFITQYQNRNRIFAKCLCECGNTKSFNLTEVKNGHIKSCGCSRSFNFEKKYKGKTYHNIMIVDLVDANRKIVKCKCHCGELFNAHLIDLLKKKRYIIACPKCNNSKYPKFNIKKELELTHPHLQKVLYGIKTRCYNPNRKDKKWYFDKKIQVCTEWLNNTQSFVDWALSNGYQEGLTIDRIDSNGNYCPENCRWVTMEVQNNNHSNVKKYDYNGESLSIAQLARKYNINRKTLNSRIKKGMTLREAITKPTKK